MPWGNEAYLAAKKPCNPLKPVLLILLVYITS